MTKTFNIVVSHRFSYTRLPVMMPLAQLRRVDLFGILNLDHWYLFEILFLVLGIFMISIKQAFFVKSVNELLK